MCTGAIFLGYNSFYFICNVIWVLLCAVYDPPYEYGVLHNIRCLFTLFVQGILFRHYHPLYTSYTLLSSLYDINKIIINIIQFIIIIYTTLVRVMTMYNIYIYIYIYMCVCVCVYVYVYGKLASGIMSLRLLIIYIAFEDISLKSMFRIGSATCSHCLNIFEDISFILCVV